MKTTMSREAARFLCRSAFPIARAGPRSRVQLDAVPKRGFSGTSRLKVLKPYILADIGEGITECQVIQWFVKPGARVEQFDPICEVQSDKASVEITSRFDGVIKKLYYEPDDMAKVGKPLVDIDIQSEISEADAVVLDGGAVKQADEAPNKQPEAKEQALEVDGNDSAAVTKDVPSQAAPSLPAEPAQEEGRPRKPPGKHASLATPAVRHMVKAASLNIEAIEGTGKDGRVLKEDVQRYVQSAKTAATTPPPSAAPAQRLEDRTQPLTPIQSAMFKKMSHSLSIPHFLYTDGVDFTSLNTIRKKYNAAREKSQRITTFPFILKAVSLALQQYPLMNARLDTQTNLGKPQLVYQGSHDIGIAVDSPSGLLVPVVRNVQSLSIEQIAAEITRLSELARTGKIGTEDLKNATITLSNIGSIGGGVVAPVIVSPQVAIVGIGRAKTVPAFGKDGELIKKEECMFSWSADHRIIDGATAARCAEVVKGYLEDVETMLIRLR
ncbi:branched-chain alpha-keto acid dehydrogenase E2 component [Bimuria novae-zelandiae CBS 107.79]|uniref:Dihydrolipoamide acetyltransferase component of pyruvate dehydrogenase complex n=1 Tax=Bimuria novae-zelandiae CBS 107.79 TaxID=1447943 RepID=A0A6A5UTK7_9PLEO|nr:branched-chain alpha-keto acid dehydrogenase E2 component [Bimuria novae-zelandiae CBS 107.79]